MKLLISLFLTAVCVHCIPISLYEDGRGHYTETRTSYVNGYNGTFNLNLGVKVGNKDGVAVLETRNNIGLDFKHYNESVVQTFDRPADATPPPPNSGSTNSPQNGMLTQPMHPWAIQNRPWAMQNGPWAMQNGPWAMPNYSWARANNQWGISRNPSRMLDNQWGVSNKSTSMPHNNQRGMSNNPTSNSKLNADAPLINNEGKNEYYKEKHTSKRRGKSFGIGLHLGVEGGIKDGVAHLETKNQLRFDVGEFADDSLKELEYPIYPTPQPFDFSSAFDYPYQYYPTYGSPYDMYGSPQFPAPYFSQYPVEYPPQYPFQYLPQYWQQYDPQYQSWQGTQYPPRYNPQNATHHKTSTPNGTTNQPSTVRRV